MSFKEKVTVLTTSYPIQDITDAGHFVEQDCISLNDLGYTVNVVCPGTSNSYGKVIQNDIPVHRFTYYLPRSFQKVAYGDGIPTNLKRSILAKMGLPFFMLSFFLRASKNSSDSDIIHCHWFIAGLIGAMIKRKNQKLILTMHHGHKSNAIFRWILKKTDLLLSNSKYTEEKTLNIYSVKDHQIAPICIDTEFFKADNQAIQPSEKIKFLFVGRLIPLKGADVLLRAFKKLINEGLSSHLTIIGEGPEHETLLQLSKNLGIENFVEFSGYQIRNRLPEILKSHDVLVAPSIETTENETEGLGLTLIEAQSCGLPVIGSNIGGIPDLIEDGQNGFLFEAGNENELFEKMQKLAQDKTLRIEFGKKGREFVVEHYSSDVGKAFLKQVYSELNG